MTVRVCWSGCRRRRVVACDRGDAGGTALVWGIGLVSLLALIWLGIQVAFTHYGQSMAQAAAQAGVRAAVTAPGDPSRAEPTVKAFLADHASRDVYDAQVSVSVDGQTVTVSVTGRGVSVVPGTRWRVDGSAAGPLEQMP